MSRRLLLADDSVTIQKVIEITLSDKDYILRIASDGDEALRMANSETPDLILADVFMPGKNGYEVCEVVRSTPALQDVPVLLLAGTFEPFDQDKAQEVGANGWIVKPFSSQSLIDKVEELLALVPAKEQWQAAPSTAPGDQDILQALEEVTSTQNVAPPAAPIIEPAFEQPVDFEPEAFEAPSAIQPAAPAVALGAFSFADEEEVSGAEPGVDPFVASTESNEATEAVAATEIQELEPFVGFDVQEDEETGATYPPNISAEPEPFTSTEPRLSAPSSTENLSFADEEELVPTELGDDLEDFSFNAEPDIASLPEPETTAAPTSDFDGLSFNAASETAVVDEATEVADPIVDLPPLEEFQATIPAAAVPADNILDLREDDIVAEGAYGSEPARVEKRVAFLSDEQLTEIVERVAGAVIERLATPLLEKVIWEVVPDLAESMVREEMAKIKSDTE